MRAPGYKELRDITDTRKKMLHFDSREFRTLRVLLRLLSLWRPPTAGVFERCIYPVWVNLILLLMGPVRNTIITAGKAKWLSIEVMYIVHELVIWLMHILGNCYFRSGDLRNALPRQPLPGTTQPLKRRLKFLNRAAILSFVVFATINCSLFVVPQLHCDEGDRKFSTDLPHIHGILDYVLYGFVIIAIIYNLSIGLALSWTMALLYVSYASRLRALEGIFLRWRKPTDDAIYFFQNVYSRPVKNSWKQISWWFLANNIVAIAIPLYGYALAQAMGGSPYHAKYLPNLICYLLFVLTIWLTPILMAEQIKRREKKFQENVNNFCLGLMKEIPEYEPSLLMTTNGTGSTAVNCSTGSNGIEIPVDTTDAYTFAPRGKELRNFLCFLEKRKQGLVSRGYAFQMNVSALSLFVGILSFIVKLNNEIETSSSDNSGNSGNFTS